MAPSKTVWWRSCAWPGVSYLEKANEVLWDFLPRFNKRFGVPSVQPGSAYREVPEELDINGVLCIKELRRVAKDNTVRYQGHTLQLFPDADRGPAMQGPESKYRSVWTAVYW